MCNQFDDTVDAHDYGGGGAINSAGSGGALLNHVINAHSNGIVDGGAVDCVGGGGARFHDCIGSGIALDGIGSGFALFALSFASFYHGGEYARYLLSPR